MGAEAAGDTVLGTLAFAKVGDLIVLCHSSRDPSDAEWEQWLTREGRREHRALLISTDGGKPNSRQRARVKEATSYPDGQRPPVALLTDSAVARHVMTAFVWLFGESSRVKVFPRAGIVEAAAWLGADGSLAPLRAALQRLHAALARAGVAAS
jgi:hypothetical protein